MTEVKVIYSSYKVKFKRVIRDLWALVNYPIWLVTESIDIPDNHIYKRKRINIIRKNYNCETFIESGTFYGQMINYAKNKFKKVISIEIYEPLYLQNKYQFKNIKNIDLYYGGSEDLLSEILLSLSGRALFWLDGHYSGSGTGGNNDYVPIIDELKQISKSERNDHCILIDDVRCFTGENGYPTLDQTLCELRKINSSYLIKINRDCIMALPRL